MDEQPLPLELTFDDRTEYLYARARAFKTNLATAELYLKQIAEKCAELGRDKLLIYRDITDVLETSSMYKLASHLPAVLPELCRYPVRIPCCVGSSRRD